MIRNITLAKALKKKNRIVGRIAYLRNNIDSNNSHLEGSRISVDVNEMLEQEAELVATLIKLKTEIARMNNEILEPIVQLSELKGRIAWLRDLDTFEGCRSNLHGVERTFDVTIDAARKAKILAEMQAKAEAAQDILDEYNARTHMTVDLPDDKMLPCETKKPPKKPDRELYDYA